MAHARTDRSTWSERSTDALIDAFYPAVEWAFDETDPFVTNLDRKLAEARMASPVELYLTTAIAISALVGVLFGLFGLSLAAYAVVSGLVEVNPGFGWARTIALEFPVSAPISIPWGTIGAAIATAATPALIVIIGLAIGSVAFTGVFGIFIALPYSRAGRRRREINMVLPDAVSFMYALSVGGMSQLEIIETMAKAEDTYGEISREFRTIVQETTYFDTDYRTAIQHCSARTPSVELSQFFTDMLSIIDSGGDMTEFLDDKKDLHFRTAKEQQQRELDTLELFSEMYITLSLFPLLLIIILVVMSLIGGAQTLLLYLTVYGLIPTLGAAFLVLVATVKQDEVGDGYIRTDDDGRRFDVGDESGPFDLGFINQFSGSFYIFERIKDREGSFRLRQFLAQPHVFFTKHPTMTFAVTVPLSIVAVIVAVAVGGVPVTWSGVVAEPVWATFVYLYLPLFLIGTPFAVFWELNVRSRRAILGDLSANLRKLASANATGLTLLESVKVVSESTSGKLGEEFGIMYAKSTYGMHLNESLVVFNNKYHVPRLARTVKLISKAHAISGEISSVLSTAARASEAQEDIERERISHARIQVAIIILTFLTLLGVMAVMKAQFVDVMAGITLEADTSAGAHGFGNTVDTALLGTLFFHAVTIQAIVSGLVCGYIRRADLASGVKYVVALAGTTLAVWLIVA